MNEGLLEAQALFDAKTGCYKDCIIHYLELLKKNFDLRKLKKELFHFSQQIYVKADEDLSTINSNMKPAEAAKIRKRIEIRNSNMGSIFTQPGPYLEWANKMAPNIILFERIF
jgi:hypothetical protein